MEITPQSRVGEIAAGFSLASRVFADLRHFIHLESNVLFSRLAAA